MTEDDAIREAVLADPADRLARCAWADRLEERGGDPVLARIARTLGSLVHSREYGGGDERWCIYPSSLPARVWEAACAVFALHPGEWHFLELHERAEALRVLFSAICSLAGEKAAETLSKAACTEPARNPGRIGG